jgi:hypothetical protein
MWIEAHNYLCRAVPAEWFTVVKQQKLSRSQIRGHRVSANLIASAHGGPPTMAVYELPDRIRTVDGPVDGDASCDAPGVMRGRLDPRMCTFQL